MLKNDRRKSMKALITSGGKGTRLRPLTHTSNKHLIPIANKPMIYYAIEAAIQAGIKEIGIVINPETADEIKVALGSGDKWGVRFTYILQEAPLGLAHVVKVSQDFLKEAPFVFYLGDNVLVGGIHRFIEEFFRDKNNCRLVLAKVKEPQRFGVADIEDGRVIRVEEKPKDSISPFAVTGIYIYDHSIFEAVNHITVSARGELEISDAHQYLINNAFDVGYSEITGWWKDTGKPEDLLEANRLILSKIMDDGEPKIMGEVDGSSDIAGRVIIEEGAKVIKSAIRGPVIIGEGTLIENSYIGPFTSVYYGCEIKNSEVEYSIVLENCKIINANVRIERSILGREVKIYKNNSKPNTQKFMLGDQSTVELT
jgi:glucose-1-phosphate thymidylyltransferase